MNYLARRVNMMKASGPPVRKVIPMPCSQLEQRQEFPTPLVIVPHFLSFFVTFFGLALLATSRHMHHPYKLGVLYVVDSVPAKGWIRQRPSDSPSPVAPVRIGRYAPFWSPSSPPSTTSHRTQHQ
ncbi:hypothetical protein QBC45DRAFT_392377 [Copromyces sp. CBS 386.78]|nr:hypothetical protein QBC45DRAFT_392377 [Copromyces sp. CBS 386.78]